MDILYATREDQDENDRSEPPSPLEQVTEELERYLRDKIYSFSDLSHKYVLM